MKNRLRETVAPLLNWYDKNARILPWRSEPTPYRVWISEIMLQQTRVEAVKPYFERFVSVYPDVSSLAHADLQQVYKLWEGLGYYSRAKNLHLAANMISDSFRGVLPSSYEKLLGLPGIGEYTAAAISSIAYNRKYAVVDGNVLRVVSRLTASREDVTKQQTKKEMKQALEQIMPGARAGDFNQAMMELGATVCLPNGVPLCESCPLNAKCKARALGIAEELPMKSAKKPRKTMEYTVLLFECGNRTAIRNRTDRGLLEGLWQFPMIEGHLDLPGLNEWLMVHNRQTKGITALGATKHVFTHIEWHMIGYLIPIDQCFEQESLVWADKSELAHIYPIPNAFSYYLKEIKKQLK